LSTPQLLSQLPLDGAHGVLAVEVDNSGNRDLGTSRWPTPHHLFGGSSDVTRPLCRTQLAFDQPSHEEVMP
jgi:hypothetical protein